MTVSVPRHQYHSNALGITLPPLPPLPNRISLVSVPPPTETLDVSTMEQNASNDFDALDVTENLDQSNADFDASMQPDDADDPDDPLGRSGPSL